MRPRIAGSTLMKTLRTRSWPAASSGSGCSTNSKFSGLGSPAGREAKQTTRVVVGRRSVTAVTCASRLHAAHEAAVDDEIDSCAVGSSRACQEGDGLGHVLGRTHAAERDARAHGVVELGALLPDPLPRSPRKLDRAG